MHKLINGNVTPDGWMMEFLLRDKSGITGNLDKLCKDACSGIFDKNKVKHEFDGVWSSWWPGEIEGNWREAYIQLALILEDKGMLRNVEEYVANILSNQSDDGYIGIYQPDERYGNGARSGELWTQSRIMRCLLVYYHYTKDENVLKSLERVADLTVTKFGPLANDRSFFEIPDEDGSKTHGLMIIEPILAVYEYFNKPEYITFCEFLYKDFSEYVVDAKFPCYDISIQMVTDPCIPFVGHGPHTCEHLRIPLLLYKATGKTIYHSIFMSAFEKLKKNMTLSGSCKSDELIGSYLGNISGSENVMNVGKSYPLPSTGYEYCSTTELMISLINAMQCTDDLVFADAAEWLVMNAAMAARRQDGKAILYLCADNLYKAAQDVGTRWDYSPTHLDTAVCCAPNSCKIMPYYLSNMWQTKEDGNLFAVFYGPSKLDVTIDSRKVTIQQKTRYPFENCVDIEISSDGEFDAGMYFRIPSWSNDTGIQFNGVQIAFEIVCEGKGYYACLKRSFKNGDQIKLTFVTKPRLMRAVDGTAAIAYGSLLYSLNISAEADDYFHYNLEPFCDTNYVPQKGADWEYTLLHNNFNPQEYLQINKTTAEEFEWDNPPVSIKAKMLSSWSVPEWMELVPIGCTTLRRTTFPCVDETV